MALQGAGHGCRVVLAAVVPQLRERAGGARASADGPDDGPARPSRASADHVLSLEVHLCEGLLPRLDVVARSGQEYGARAAGAAPPAELVCGPEGPRPQAKRLEALEPRVVMPSAFGPPLAFLALRRVDQEPLEATRLEQLAEREPI